MARKLVLIGIVMALVGAALWSLRRTASPPPPMTTTLRGVVLDLEGEPLRSHRLFARLTTNPDEPPTSEDARLGNVLDGTFEWTVDSDNSPTWLVIGELGYQGCFAWARLGLDGVRGESAFVGQLRLEQPPLVASGQVVDPRGELVDGVQLTFTSRPDLMGALRRPIVTTTHGGHFELRGWSAATTYLWGRKGTQFHKLAQIPLGSTDLTLDSPVALLRVRSWIDERFARIAFNLIAETYASDLAPTWWENTRLAPGGASREFLVEPGRVHLSVKVPFSDVAFWEDELELHPGDSEDVLIDLRAAIQQVALNVVDEAGRPIEHAFAHLVGEDRTLVPSEPTGRDGRTRVLMTGDPRPIDVLVLAIGYKAADLRGATDETTVVLEPDLPVRIVVEGAPALSPSTYRLGVHAVSLDVRLGGFCSASGVCRLDGPAELDLGMPTAGRWNLRWSLKHRTASGWDALMLTTEPEIVEVREGEGERVYHVAAPAEAIAIAVAKLERE
jgi:hypothetical protein